MKIGHQDEVSGMIWDGFGWSSPTYLAERAQNLEKLVAKSDAELTALRKVAEAAEKFQNKAGPVADYGNDFIEADRNLMNALAEWRRSK